MLNLMHSSNLNITNDYINYKFISDLITIGCGYIINNDYKDKFC